MSFNVFFDFSVGLKKSLRVPAGTKASLLAHVVAVETTLGIERTRYKDNPIHWGGEAYRRGFPDVDNKILCRTAEDHNRWVRWTFDRFQEWSAKPTERGELLKPADAAEFWHGLERLRVEPARWTPDFYRARMDELYEAMRGRDAAGMIFDAKTLTPKQASAVINLFDPYLDVGDLRLDVPKGYDHLLPSGAHEGGYDWCEKCGAIDPHDDGCRKRGCPVAAERQQ